MPVENELRCDQGAGWGLWAVQGFVKRSWPREQAGQTSTSLCEQTAPPRGQVVKQDHPEEVEGAIFQRGTEKAERLSAKRRRTHDSESEQAETDYMRGARGTRS
mmetsp:Transcript_14133/g.37603  ORF Transcript_14133/g.37603 Transcript_14133/m.37603 type:complete len:104 (+) Transcript_14133:285-596(+)